MWRDCEAAERGGQQGAIVVDGITGLGTTHFDGDGWEIDVLIGGSAEGVMIPRAWLYLSVSEQAWAAMEGWRRILAFYFDLPQGAQERVKGESGIRRCGVLPGWARHLDYIAGQAGGDLEKGRIALIDNRQVNAAATRADWWRWVHTLCAPAPRRRRRLWQYPRE